MNLEEYKEMMANQAKYDREKNQAQISAPTLKEALKQAAIELSIPIKDISYEILQRGRKGVFGVGYQDCIIIAYESENKRSKSGDLFSDEILDSQTEQGNVVADVDGVASIRCIKEKVYLRVKPPVANGKPATITNVEYWLRRRGIGKYDIKLINDALSLMDYNEYQIGEFIHNSASDGGLDIFIADDDMSASLMLREPGPGGEDVGESAVHQYISEMNVLYGINKEVLNDLIHFPVYGKEIEIAQGKRPQNGKDATIQYFFETDRKKLLSTEVNGRVDFKNTNLIQNVEEGQLLARKVPATKGISGITVTGRELDAKDGSDINLNAGENVLLSSDKTEITAAINGQVLLSETGRISVAPVFYVSGDVNIKSGGNIDFIGGVVVRGNVEDGFSVKATKNIEIGGSVGKSFIEADGDIHIAMGINGREEGLVQAKGNLATKFIENAKVSVAGDVIVRDAIVNSIVDSNSSIICSDGKKGRIVGGRLRASKSVVAKAIGNESYTETIIEVGFEPEKVARFEELQQLMEKAQKDISDLSLNLGTFDKNINEKAQMSSEKIENIKTMRLRREELTNELTNYTKEFSAIKEYLDSLKNDGTISVAGIVYPGVKINICGAELKIKNEMKWTTFYKDGPVIRMKEYSEKERRNVS